MRLELFISESCTNCRVLKKQLKEVLDEMGEDYERVVSERSVEDSEVMAELLMLNVDSVPVIRFQDEVYKLDNIRDKKILKEILMAGKKRG